jgi:OmpA-OmpF porin, OOP family
MNALRSMAAAGSLVAAAATAQAADFYAGAAIGQSDWRIKDLPQYQIDRRHVAGKVYAGWQFLPNFALEGGYTHFGRARITGVTIPGAVNIRGEGVFADVVASVPVADRFSLLARLGVVHSRTKFNPPAFSNARDSGTRAKAGLGAEFTINPQLGLRAEWERHRFDMFNDRTNVDLWSVGVRAKF